MRVSLDELDASGLLVDLPMGGADSDKRVASVRTAKGLGGLFEQNGGDVSVSELRAASIDLDSLHLDFGAVIVKADGKAGEVANRSANGELRRVEGHFTKRGEHVALDVGAAEVFASRLTIDVTDPGVRVSGELRVKGMRIRVDGPEGRVEGAEVELVDFRLTFGDLEVRAPRAEAKAMVIGWGEGGFLLEAEKLVGPAIEIALGTPRAKVDARGIDLEGLRFHGGDIELRVGALAALRVDAEVPKKDEEAGGDESKESQEDDSSQIFDLVVLDGLRGELNFDLFVDLSVPIIGWRRATHRFRIPIEEGSLDYMSLEGDLSRLENTLLDFALRKDGTLVLERGIPLLPTRGRGKPILVWDLSEDDLALARRERMRLALLPKARLANEAAKEDAETRAGKTKEGSALALRQLGVLKIDARLNLDSIGDRAGGVVRDLTLKAVSVKGDVHHEPDDPTREGEILASLGASAMKLLPLPVGAQSLRVDGVAFESASSVRVRFLDVRPRDLDVAIEGLAIEGLSLRSR